MTVKRKAGPGKGKGAPNAKGGGAGNARGGKKGARRKKKKKHKCGDNGPHGKLKRESSAGKKNGVNEFERDHVPSFAALEKAAGNMLKKGEVCPKQSGRLYAAADACAIPYGVHREYSETCGSKNNPTQISKDAGGLKTAANRDTKAVQEGLSKTKQSKECKKRYKEWADRVNARDKRWYDKLIKKALKKKPSQYL